MGDGPSLATSPRNQRTNDRILRAKRITNPSRYSDGLLDDAAKIATSLVGKADQVLFPGWPEHEYVDVELFREFTKVLAKEFPTAGLHAKDKDYVSRVIKLLRRANYRAKADD